MKLKYFMKWREDFDDQSGEFTSREKLIIEIKRIKKLIEEDDGEACIYEIICGEDVTSDFL